MPAANVGTLGRWYPVATTTWFASSVPAVVSSMYEPSPRSSLNARTPVRTGRRASRA